VQGRGQEEIGERTPGRHEADVSIRLRPRDRCAKSLDGIRRASIGGKDVERDRILSDEELARLWVATRAANLSRRSALAVWLILATACRAGEAMAARWEHVDWIKRTWYLPETKNQRDHVIHLSDFALQQIEALSSLRELDRGGSSVPWLFPTKSGTGHLCVKSFGKQLADRQRTEADRLQNRTKQTDSLALQGGRWVAHDLRRTAATMMARSGVPTDVIDECLNHKLRSKVSRVYIKDRRLQEQIVAFDRLGSMITDLVSGDESRKSVVVPIRAAA